MSKPFTDTRTPVPVGLTRCRHKPDRKTGRTLQGEERNAVVLALAKLVRHAVEKEHARQRVEDAKIIPLRRKKDAA